MSAFCKDCRWYLKKWWWKSEDAACYCPKVTSVDLISGRTEPHPCFIQRLGDYPDRCGKKGQWFEPKEKNV